jgi:RNA polymerase sigma factor (sigma-70 family)
MATSPMSGVIQHLRGVLRDGAGLTDGQLLEEYIGRRDDAAFAALVRRHGPMVWGVCRRVLRNSHDAEDAFQATFLVLVRKAASIARRELLANWLYGVAHQTALKARATAARKKGREWQVTQMPEPAVTEQDPWRDLQPLLDEALSRLPDRYRCVVVLCDLEGKTRKEAARSLGLPEGTVASRLVRARMMLAKRLRQRGVALSAGALAAALAQQAVSASVPSSVVSSTIQAASLFAAGQAAAAGAISGRVVALTEGVVQTMFVSRIKTAIAVVLMLGLVATGATLLTCHTAAGQDDRKPIAEKPVEPAAKQEKEKEGFTAWGKEVGFLQAGLGFRRGEKRAYAHGETITLVVRVRNVGKQEVEFQYLKEFFKENPPVVTDADGRKLPADKILYTPLKHVPEEVSLAPGQEIELSSEQYQLMPTSERVKGHSGRFQPLWTGTGKVSVQYSRLFGNTSGGRIKVDPDFLDLTTGSLELEIKPAPPPATEKK